MISFRTAVAALVLTGGVSGVSVATPDPGLAFLDNIERHGFDRVADLYPDILYLHSSGNGCRNYPVNDYRDLIPADPAEQTRIGLCALQQMMHEARATADTVVEARITVREENLVRIVRGVVDNDTRLRGLDWEIRVNSRLPISNEDVVLSFDVVALSSGSNEALQALPPAGRVPTPAISAD